jgi:hypothetical protein
VKTRLNPELPLRVYAMREDEVSITPEANRVPMWRVKENREPVLMGWARRDERLWNVVEIQIGDEFTDIVCADTDASGR